MKSCLLNQSKLEEISRYENQHVEMGNTNELMEFLSASLGATLDEIYQRLIDCDFTREGPGLAMFVVALLNALGREGRGNRPTEVVLMLAFGESGTAERGRNRLMRWRRGEVSGHDLAREPGLGEQRDHRLGEMLLPVQPAQPLIGAKRLRDGPGPSHSAESPTAASPLKRVRVSEIEIQTSETIETLEKKERDQNELCAKLQEYRTISRERDEWKKKFENLQIAYKEEEIKHLKELYMARVSQVSPEVLATMNSSEASRTHVPGRGHRSCAHREGPRLLSRHHSLLPTTRESQYQTPPTPILLLSFKNHSIRWLEQQWMRSTEPLGGHWVESSLPNALIILPAAQSEHPKL